ncbi:MAG: ABC transporter permease [Phyllobacterium sp.]
MAAVTSFADVDNTASASTVQDGPAASADLERILPAGTRRRRSLPRGLGKGLGPIALATVWWASTHYGWISEDLLPGPQTLWFTLGDLIESGEFGQAVSLSLYRVIVGFSLGFVTGVGLALLSGLLRIGEDLIDAPMQMARTLPWAGLVPLLIIWLGIDETPKITLVAFAVTFPLYINTFAGIRNVDKNLVEAAKTLSFSRVALIFQVILPGALPNLLVGLRYSLGSAWLALVFAETVNAQGGLGYLITHAREVYRVDIIILCLVIYALLGLSADLIVRLLERVLLGWRQNFDGA